MKNGYPQETGHIGPCYDHLEDESKNEHGAAQLNSPSVGDPAVAGGPGLAQEVDFEESSKM